MTPTAPVLMSGKSFVDTNILLYAKDSSEADKQPIAEALMRELWEARSGCLSVQVYDGVLVVNPYLGC